MKHTVLFAICLVAAASALAGVTYDFHSETTGLQEVAIDGNVAAEGPNIRMTMTKGDGMLFKDGAILLSHDGGKSVAIYDAVAKTYYEISLDDLSAGAAGMLKNSGFKITFVNPAVTVKDGGDGGTMNGYPTQKSVLDGSIDINIDAMGQTITSKMSMHGESWTTDKIAANAINLFQQRGVTTGIEALDKLIAAQSASLKGRFPLKQVTTIHLAQNGRDITSTTTATVSNIKEKPVEASVFASPEGFTKVKSPLAQ